MAKFAQLEEDFFVAGQVGRSALKHAAAIGVKLVINNRPNGEEEGQPTSDDVAEWAARLGLEYAYVPLAPKTLDEIAVRDFGMAREAVPGRGLAFCRSGTRSCMLWAADMAARLGTPADELQSAAEAAGYDLRPLQPVLAQMSAAHGRSGPA